MRYFRFTNWDRHQHYGEPSPPWAKVYAKILDPENDWYKLTDAQSGQLVRIVALACRRENTMPFDGELIADEIHASEPVDLNVFRDLGLITVHATRAECLAIERDRLRSRATKRGAEKGGPDANNHADNLRASKSASVNASVNASLREQSTESENREQKKNSGSGSSSSSEGVFGTETVQRSHPDPAAPSEADAAVDSSLAKREAEREERWQGWQASLLATSDDEPDLVRSYVAALDRAACDFYAAKGGRWTPTRKAKTADGLARFHPDAQLAAIEIWCDRWSNTKDERYLVGIARRLSHLSEAEFTAEIRRHRNTMAGAGLHATVTEGT